MQNDIIGILVKEFGTTESRAQNVVALIDEGNTIPFIARYRKELTGDMDDQVLREFSDRLAYLKNLFKRKDEVFSLISQQENMTPEIEKALIEAQTLTEVDDIYRPFRPKKKTRATVAAERGLKPLAEEILKQDGDTDIEALAATYVDPEKQITSAKDAIDGACDIIAETISDNSELRKKLRQIYRINGAITVKSADKSKENFHVFEMYENFAEEISKIPPHRVLALNRGETEGVLKVKVEVMRELAVRVISAIYIKGGGGRSAHYVQRACEDSFDRLISPSIEREIRAELTDAASEQAIKMFDVNLRPLLLQPPVKGKVTMGLDPAYRTGCKIAVVNEHGKVLATTVVYPTPPQNRTEQAKQVLGELIRQHDVEVIAIGNGTASKEAEIFIADLLKETDKKVYYAVVNEAGASVYSASKLAAEEFPDFDVSLRSAVSIARRLQDPLAELIKIDPKSIGVGQYQHDMPQARLNSVLSGVLEDCVNSVGVDLNTASVSLLTYVSGLNTGIAKNIIEYRDVSGGFTARGELLKVAKLGPKTYTQCAGFLRISGAQNILDSTAVHPESYGAARALLSAFGYGDEDVRLRRLSELPEKVKGYGEQKLANQCGVGVPTLRDIVAELLRPGRDIRDTLPQPVLRSDILDLSDLAEGMEIDGTVRNVIDFGVFVDIGVHQDGLVHISQIADKFIRHPSEVLKVGQAVRVRVLSVDRAKKRISLTIKGVKQPSHHGHN